MEDLIHQNVIRHPSNTFTRIEGGDAFDSIRFVCRKRSGWSLAGHLPDRSFLPSLRVRSCSRSSAKVALRLSGRTCRKLFGEASQDIFLDHNGVRCNHCHSLGGCFGSQHCLPRCSICTAYGSQCPSREEEHCWSSSQEVR